MDAKKLPKDLKGLTLYDNRPAYLFLDQKGRFPMTEKMHGKEVCIYCARLASRDKPCHCWSSKIAAEYNKTIDLDQKG